MTIRALSNIRVQGALTLKRSRNVFLLHHAKMVQALYHRPQRNK